MAEYAVSLMFSTYFENFNNNNIKQYCNTNNIGLWTVGDHNIFANNLLLLKDTCVDNYFINIPDKKTLDIIGQRHQWVIFIDFGPKQSLPWSEFWNDIFNDDEHEIKRRIGTLVHDIGLVFNDTIDDYKDMLPFFNKFQLMYSDASDPSNLYVSLHDATTNITHGFAFVNLIKLN